MLLETRIPLKYLLSKVRIELPIIILYATAVQVFEEKLSLGHFALPIAIPALLGTAISLILTFRINQSYDRWWEARKVWGAIVNDSRSLVRQLLIFTERGTADELVQKITHRQMTWCYALGEALRDQDPLQDKAQYLDADELSALEKHSNVPNALLLDHGRDIDTLLDGGQINAYQQVQLDSTISRLCDSMGMCERINNTVFPKQYSLLVEFLVYLFVLILPFGLIEHFGVLEAPVVILIATPFFLLEKTALHLQDPFQGLPTDVPVTAIARTIEENLHHMLDEHFEKQPAEPTFYVM